MEDTGDSFKIQNEPMINRVFTFFEKSECKAVKTPLLAVLDLYLEDGKELEKTTSYKNLVGALMHLSNTVRPDITFAVKYLVRFMHRPANEF